MLSVMIVDDSRSSLPHPRRMSSTHAGLCRQSVEEVDRAPEAATEEPFDLVIVDHTMPGTDRIRTDMEMNRMNMDPGVDRIEGDAVFLAVDRLHDRLRTALSRDADLTLDVSGVDAADVSFVQLLVSATLTAQRAGRALTLSKASPALCGTLALAGIAYDPITGRIALN